METYIKPSLLDRRDYKSIKERFMDKVEICKDTGCWEWIGKTTERGYGHFKLDGKMQRANIVSWRLFKGSIESGFDVCHNCPCGDNPSCVNPNHLYLDTRANHLRESYGKGQRDMARIANAERLFSLYESQKISVEEVKAIIALHSSNLFTEEEIAEWINEQRT
jgi:hypothetical protein